MKRKTYLIWSLILLLIGFALMIMLLPNTGVFEPTEWRGILEQWGWVHPKPQVTVSTTQARPGEFLVIRVDRLGADQTMKVTAPCIIEEPRVFLHGPGAVTLIPLDYRTTPGMYVLEAAVMKNGRVIHKLEQNITVGPRDFATQKMYVSPELLSRRDEELWAEDRIFTSQARSQPTPRPLWEGSFVKPLEGRITTQFGQIRYINDQESGRHSGLDIAAPEGTPIAASNHGVVVLACLLHVTGNTVILDHGLNLFTSYAHLDQISVQLGQEVTKGQMIGTVGNTGFSTGSHLHWGVSIGSVFVDPTLVMVAAPLGH